MAKIALVTGGSSGIGLSLAEEFARRGYELILVAREEKQLKEAKTYLSQFSSGEISIISLDLTSPHASTQLQDWLSQNTKKLDILVNNAGIGTSGAFLESDIDQEIAMMRLNMEAVVRLTHRLSRYLDQNGRILNVASTAAFLPGPYMSTYYATKAFVLSFSLALAEELSDLGIQVSTLCPGATNTNFAKMAEAEDSDLFKNTGRLMSADEVARKAVLGLERGKRLIVPGWSNKVQVFLLRFMPYRWAAKIAQMLNTD